MSTDKIVIKKATFQWLSLNLNTSYFSTKEYNFSASFRISLDLGYFGASAVDNIALVSGCLSVEFSQLFLYETYP